MSRQQSSTNETSAEPPEKVVATATFVVDENVENEIASLLEARGHRVFKVGRDLPRSTADMAIIAFAETVSGIAITYNIKHFDRHLARRARSHPHASLVGLKCQGPDGPRRVRALVTDLEREWKEASTRRDQRVFVTISPEYLKLHR